MKRELAEMRGSMQKFEQSQNQSLDASHQSITPYDKDHQQNTTSSFIKQEADQ
jgi:sec-independent protein translocase protein TatB